MSNAAAYVICFDEALNRVSQRGQMDLAVRFWDITKQQVVTRYLNSVFFGRSRVEDMIVQFKEGLAGLDIRKMVQVSMDGRNVNLSFL